MYSYRKHSSWTRLKLGLLVSLSLLLVGTAVLSVEGIRALFVERVSVHSRFADVRGLRTGAPVRVSGMEIGYVQSLSFRQDGKINVTMVLRRGVLRHLKKDAKASITTLGLLGDKYVTLSPGSQGAGGLGPGDMIQGETPLEIRAKQTRRFAEAIGLGCFMSKTAIERWTWIGFLQRRRLRLPPGPLPTPRES
jgi:phospholipid/cholesterol/gamma-HCH transport system substrate-binding protein